MSGGLTHPASWWTSNNPILDQGQVGVEDDTGSSKVGDGLTAWNSLTYQEQVETYTTASGTNTYVADLTFPTILGLGIGMKFRVKFSNSNTGASTLNINGLGAKTIKKVIDNRNQHMGTTGLKDLQNGDILANAIYTLQWDGTYLQLLA